MSLVRSAVWTAAYVSWQVAETVLCAGWARILPDVKLRSSKARDSEILGHAKGGSHVLIAQVVRKHARIQPLYGLGGAEERWQSRPSAGLPSAAAGRPSGRRLGRGANHEQARELGCGVDDDAKHAVWVR